MAHRNRWFTELQNGWILLPLVASFAGSGTGCASGTWGLGAGGLLLRAPEGNFLGNWEMNGEIMANCVIHSHFHTQQ